MTDLTAPAPADAAAPDRAADRPSRSIRFSARDLMQVAIFAVICFVLGFAIAMVGVISPLVMLITLPLAPVVIGVPYMLFLTRVKHPGMVLLFGTALGLAYFLTGQPWQALLLTLLTSALGELILWAGRYRSKWAAIWTYTVVSLWMIGPWIPFFTDPVGYLSSPGMAGMGEAYAREFAAIATVPAVLAMCAASAVGGFLGGLLGSALLRKHFRKAGLA